MYFLICFCLIFLFGQCNTVKDEKYNYAYNTTADKNKNKNKKANLIDIYRQHDDTGRYNHHHNKNNENDIYFDDKLSTDNRNINLVVSETTQNTKNDEFTLVSNRLTELDI